MRKDGGASVQAKPRDVTVCDRVAPSNGGFAWKTVGGKGRRKQRRGRQNDRYCKPTAGRCGGRTPSVTFHVEPGPVIYPHGPK